MAEVQVVSDELRSVSLALSQVGLWAAILQIENPRSERIGHEGFASGVRASVDLWTETIAGMSHAIAGGGRLLSSAAETYDATERTVTAVAVDNERVF